MEQVARRVTIADVAYPVSCLGHRDHSWGGERDWAKFHRWATKPPSMAWSNDSCCISTEQVEMLGLIASSTRTKCRRRV